MASTFAAVDKYYNHSRNCAQCGKADLGEVQADGKRCSKGELLLQQAMAVANPPPRPRKPRAWG